MNGVPVLGHGRDLERVIKSSGARGVLLSTATIDAAIGTGDFSVAGNALAFRALEGGSGITVIRNWMSGVRERASILP